MTKKKDVGTNQTKKSRQKAVTQFYVVWTKPPSDEVVIDAGVRALRVYMERQKEKDEK